MAGENVPDLYEGEFAVCGKLYVVLFGVGPGLTKIIRGAEKRSPERTVDRGPQTRASVAAIIGHRVNTASREVRPRFFPFVARRIRAKHKRAFHRAHEHEIVTGIDTDLIRIWH